MKRERPSGSSLACVLVVALLLLELCLTAGALSRTDTGQRINEFHALEQVVLSSGLFNSSWYTATYPDVASTSMSSIQHFLSIGGPQQRDPGPNFSSLFYAETHPQMNKDGEAIPLVHFLQGRPQQVAYDGGLVLKAAAKLAEIGAYEQAVTLAEKHLPKKLKHTIHLLKANQAQAQGKEKIWLRHLNKYLAHFGNAPVQLDRSGGSLYMRLSSDPLPRVATGPLVTVIMPTSNAEKSIELAAQSILNQTWQSLELIVVDDASEDRTHEILKGIASRDSRVRLLRNKVPTGPYVAKNSALIVAKGDYITGHDADDWAHPQRLERQMAHMLTDPRNNNASIMFMVRLTKDGRMAFMQKAKWINTISLVRYFFDGSARLSFVSAMFNRKFFNDQLGFYDSVRYAADSDMLFRANLATGGKVEVLPFVSMLCLDSPKSLTGGITSNAGRSTVLTPVRVAYSGNYTLWWRSALQRNQSIKVEFPAIRRPFPAPDEILVSQRDVCSNLANMPRKLVSTKTLDICRHN